MHGLWGMGQTCLRRGFGRQVMFTKYIVVVDDDVDVHNTGEVLFRLCANTDPQRDSMVAVRKDSPKARPTCSTTPPAKSPRPVR
jgi:4-hydroxy-3-polyprenylbenzoate decarboxylase